MIETPTEWTTDVLDIKGMPLDYALIAVPEARADGTMAKVPKTVRLPGARVLIRTNDATDFRVACDAFRDHELFAGSLFIIVVFEAACGCRHYRLLADLDPGVGGVDFCTGREPGVVGEDVDRAVRTIGPAVMAADVSFHGIGAECAAVLAGECDASPARIMDKEGL